MEIIKHGKQEEPKTVEVFRCFACGCLFEANVAEYKIMVDDTLVIHSCKCPECSHKAYKVYS